MSLQLCFSRSSQISIIVRALLFVFSLVVSSVLPVPFSLSPADLSVSTMGPGSAAREGLGTLALSLILFVGGSCRSSRDHGS